MGAEERQPDADLTPEERAEAERRGRLAAYELNAARFSFYRLLYLLERLYPESPRLGYVGPAAQERIRLRGDP